MLNRALICKDLLQHLSLFEKNEHCTRPGSQARVLYYFGFEIMNQKSNFDSLASVASHTCDKLNKI